MCFYCACKDQGRKDHYNTINLLNLFVKND